MATILNRQVTFSTNGTVTSEGLHNLIDQTEIYAGIITTQPVITSVGSSDQLLIADADHPATSAPRRVTVGSMFNDALSNGIYTSSSFTGTLTAGSFVGPLNGNVTGTIIGTGGTISSLTTGTTTSTAANITNGTVQTLTASTANITTGTIATFNSTTGTIAGLNSTNGTVATLNSTTGTIGTLVATGTITGSTNVVNIGSGQIYKDSSGNVGIGATSPAGKLDVVGGRSFFSAASEQFGIGVRYVSTGGPVYFGAASSSATPDAVISAAGGGALMTLQNGGNVGIGTASPAAKLDVVGGRSIFSAASDSFAIGARYVSTSGIVYFGAASASATPDAIISRTDGATLMTLQNGGNVGIGVTTPVNKLEIVGSFGRGAPVTKTADFSLAATENWIIVDKATTICTATLPAASSWTGREFTIKTLRALAVVSASANVVSRGSSTAGTLIVASGIGNYSTLVSDGTNWVTMGGS
jgi:hypothetical protein